MTLTELIDKIVKETEKRTLEEMAERGRWLVEGYVEHERRKKAGTL